LISMESSLWSRSFPLPWTSAQRTPEHVAAAISSLGPAYEAYASRVIDQGIDGPCVAFLLHPSRSDEPNGFFDKLGVPPGEHRAAFRALFHDFSDDKKRWMKAFLILETCLKGIRPFVGSVMQRLHTRVIEMVKENITRDFGVCEVDEWDCSTCDDDEFLETPVVLDIHEMDENGVVDFGSPHRLKPHIFMPCRLNNIPVGYFPDAEENFDAISPSVPLLICSNPADKRFEAPHSSTSILLRETRLDSSTQHLTPFVVTLCWPIAPEREFHAVLCSSCPGQTARLVNAFASGRPPPEPHSGPHTRSFAFWALNVKDAYNISEQRHGVKPSHILRFDGRDLPPGIMRGCRYMVTEATNFSFNVCGPIVCPVRPMTAGSPLTVVLRSTVGR
jgi:hypothetical protein